MRLEWSTGSRPRPLLGGPDRQHVPSEWDRLRPPHIQPRRVGPEDKRTGTRLLNSIVCF